MSRIRLTATISLCLTLLLVILCLSLYVQPAPELEIEATTDGYTAHWMHDDGQMLRADSGGSKIRFINSQSAGQYDVDGKDLEGQTYTGASRRQYEIDILRSGVMPKVKHGSELQAERDKILKMPLSDMLDLLGKKRVERGLSKGPGFGAGLKLRIAEANTKRDNIERKDRKKFRSVIED